MADLLIDEKAARIFDTTDEDVIELVRLRNAAEQRAEKADAENRRLRAILARAGALAGGGRPSRREVSMTGQDIIRALERIGVPEWMETRATSRGVEMCSERNDGEITAWLSLDDRHRGGVLLNVRPDRPRASEASALLLRAYDAAKQTAAKEDDHA